METFSNSYFVFLTLPFVVLIDLFLKPKWKNGVILLFSFLFLFWVCSYKIVFLLLIVSIFTQLSAFFICKSQNSRFKFFICMFNIFFILALTIFSFQLIFSKFFLNLFFDFERILFVLICMANISYLVDVYRKHASFQKSLLKFLTYVFMFPKLLMGPVLIYYKFNRQLTYRKTNIEMLSSGIELFIVGFAKKILFANEFYEIYCFVINQTISSLPVLTAWFGIFSGFLSFLFNFSGYSDMAVGVGKMLGFQFPANVKKLFFVDRVSDFFKQFNYLPVVYFKNYIFPWSGRFGFYVRLIKLFLIGFFMALFFGGRVECFIASAYFVLFLILEKFLVKLYFFKVFKNVVKFFNLIILLIGMVLFQNCGVLNNLTYLGMMFGMSGFLIDFSFVFWILFVKFLILIFVLLFCRFFKRKFLQKKMFSFLLYFKHLGLIILFLFSILLNLSQI